MSGEPTREESIRWASGPPGGRPVPDFPGGVKPSLSVGDGGMPDASVGNNPAHNRREGSSTFLPGHGAPTTTKKGEYNNPASPTGRGGRKFRPALPPAYSPPKVFERLPAPSTYYGSTTGLVAPRMPPPAASWPPPPVPPDEGVSAQSEREAKEGQVMRRLRKKLVHKYGDWRGCFKVGDQAPGMVSRKDIAAFLHHRNVLLTPDEHKVLFNSLPGGESAQKVPFKTFVDAIEGGTKEQMAKADADFEKGKARVAALLKQANEWPFAQELIEHMSQKNDGLSRFFLLMDHLSVDGLVQENELSASVAQLLPQNEGIEEQVQALYAHLRHQTKPYGTIEGLDQVELRTLLATKKVDPQAKVVNMPKTHIEDREDLEAWVPGMRSRRLETIANLEDAQLDLLPATATEGLGRTHERQQAMIREASEATPLSETWGAQRQAQKRAVDGSYYGDYDGVRALANSASGYGGLGRLGGERGPWSGASGDNRMSQTNFAQRTALQNGPMSLSPASPNSLSAARSAASLASGRSPRGTASLGRSRSSPGLSFSSPLSPGWDGVRVSVRVGVRVRVRVKVRVRP